MTDIKNDSNGFTVALILDRSFGKRLSRLQNVRSIWCIQSKINTKEIEELRTTHSEISYTTFDESNGEDLTSLCSNILFSLDEHEGPISHGDKGYKTLLVYGATAHDFYQQDLDELQLQIISKDHGYVTLQRIAT